MRSRLFLSLVAAAGLLVGSSANAGPLVSATWDTTLQGVNLNITQAGAVCTDDPMANHTQQTIGCPGIGLGATGTANSTNYSVGLTVGLFTLNQFTTGGAINIHTKVALGTDAIGISGNNSSAVAPTFVNGQVTVKVAAHVGMGANASMLTPGMTTLVKVPLDVGKAGTFTGSFTVLTSPHYITVDFYAWTPHTITFTGLTTKFAALPDVTAQGSFMLTASGGGTVTLVSPSKISIDGPLAQRRTASFTSLTLSYAPEPSTLLLLGAGVVGLALVGSRKRS